MLRSIVLMHLLLYASTAYGVPNPLSYANGRFILNLFRMFLPEFEHLSQCGLSIQFGVMVMGRLEANDLRPQPLQFGSQAVATHNYQAAVPQRYAGTYYTEHSEQQMALAFNELVDNMPNLPSDVYIFTVYSPCVRCARILRDLAIQNPQTNFHIGYIEPYVNRATGVATLSQAQNILQAAPNIFFGELGGQCFSIQFPHDELRRKRTIDNCITVTCDNQNIPLIGKPTSQSSTYDVHASPSENAVDGNTNGNYYAFTCSITGYDTGAWWMVNLGDNQCIGEVVIYNRDDCCKERLADAIVRVGTDDARNNPVCGTISLAQINANQEINVICNLRGQFISIELPRTDNLQICEVKAYGGLCNDIPLIGKPTSQSSTYDVQNSPSENAVDGNTNGNYHAFSCSITGNDAGAWWMVNLGINRCVAKVIIYNRDDCCKERLADAIVRVGPDDTRNNPICGTISLAQINANQEIDVSCNVRGQFISIELPRTDYLQICEVRAYAGLCNDIPLIGKPTSQSSTYDVQNSPSENAVDGNTNGNYHAFSCSITGNDAGAWWMVNLGINRCVGKVIIYNRDDCCKERLADAIVRVGPDDTRNNPICGTISLAQINANQEIDVSCNVRGQFISIELPRTDYLQICEVRAYAGLCNDIPLIGKPTSQSSTYDVQNSPSENAVDGNTNGNYHAFSCSITGNDAGAWWMVNLGINRCVGKVIIYNRDDCCKERLADAIVRVGPDDTRNNPICGTISLAQINANQEIDVSCNVRGQFISIELPRTDYLQICEVRAYAGLCNDIPLIGKPTSQSSTYDIQNSPSENAVDGNTNGNYHAFSCSITENDAGAWWTVNLGVNRCVGKVTIYNRNDCCKERLSGAIVRVGSDAARNNPACGTISLAQINANQKIEVSCNLLGEFISIELPRTDYLQICEVRAYAGQCYD